MVTKVAAFFVGLAGAVSAFFAFFALKQINSKRERKAVSAAREKAQQSNSKRKEAVEQKIEAAVEPIKKLGNSRADRESLADMLDE